MRRAFKPLLYKAMQENTSIWLLSGDLGYGFLDDIRRDFPERFLNCGASEQAMMGLAVGLAMKGKIPFVYSISTFLLRRAYETIFLYINHERLNVKLIGGGREKDYTHDGVSHWMLEDRDLFTHVLSNIQGCWPEKEEDLPGILELMLKYNKPYYLNLKR